MHCDSRLFNGIVVTLCCHLRSWGGRLK